MATKPENVNTLAILLELDKDDKKDLANLKPKTLENMVSSYIENAKRTNLKAIEEHINTSLPVVGTNIMVMLDGEFVKCKRETFLIDNTKPVTFIRPDETTFSLAREKIRWKPV